MEIDRVWSEESTPAAQRQPLVAFAIHDGHLMRQDVAESTLLAEEIRLREQDPFTGRWTRVAPTRIVGLVSRFQIDLNRPREKAFYREPADAWGLAVRREPLPESVAGRSLAEYDAFYARMQTLLQGMTERFGRFVVFDLHSYNHRRDGPDGPAANPDENPQVNLGTGTMERSKWAPVVDRFISDLRAYDFPDGGLDVRENVKFQGGNLARWIHNTFPDSACVLSIEFRKFFMDEWTGEPNHEHLVAIRKALRSTVGGVVDEVTRL